MSFFNNININFYSYFVLIVLQNILFFNILYTNSFTLDVKIIWIEIRSWCMCFILPHMYIYLYGSVVNVDFSWIIYVIRSKRFYKIHICKELLWRSEPLSYHRIPPWYFWSKKQIGVGYFLSNWIQYIDVFFSNVNYNT